MRALQKLWTDEQGQGLVEYVLIIALISIGLVAIMLVFRNAIGDIFHEISQTLENADSPGYTAPGGGET